MATVYGPMTRIGSYNKLSSVQRNIAMKPMPVVTDKALLALGPYSVPLVVSSCETGEPLGIEFEMR
jgi:hypothetical protein